MTLPDLLLSQLADPFRIGLLIALFVTMLRTRAASGVWVPLAALCRGWGAQPRPHSGQ